MAHIMNFFIYWPRMFILSTLFAYGVLMTSKDSNHQYDLGVKCQGQVYSKSVLACDAFIFSRRECLWFVDDNKGFALPL